LTTDRNIQDLHPLLLPWYQRLISDLATEGITARIIQGWRDSAYQDQLHAQGISPLTGQDSKHCYVDSNGNPASKAFDLGIFGQDGAYVVNGKDSRYGRAGALWEQYSLTDTAKTQGLALVWGGDFIHPAPDYDHFQMA
jgi:hypothetical protein